MADDGLEINCKRCSDLHPVDYYPVIHRAGRKNPTIVQYCYECRRKRRKLHYDSAKRSKYSKQWRANNAEYNRTRTVEYRANLKRAALNQYGNKCACCDEDFPAFLCIDHIGGGGNKHRAAINCSTGGYKFYLWLYKNNYPAGFRVLCHNCNMAITWFDHDVDKLRTAIATHYTNKYYGGSAIDL